MVRHRRRFPGGGTTGPRPGQRGRAWLKPALSALLVAALVLGAGCRPPPRGSLPPGPVPGGTPEDGDRARDLRVTAVEFSYPFGPVPLEDPTYRVLYRGPAAGPQGEVVVRFSLPLAMEQPYTSLRYFQNGKPRSAHPEGSYDPIYEMPAQVQYRIEVDRLHIRLPAGLLVLILPGNTASACGAVLGEDTWIWLSSQYFSPFDFVIGVGRFANLPRGHNNHRRVGVVFPAAGVHLRASPSESDGSLLQLPQGTNLRVEGSPLEGWLEVTLFEVVGDRWTQAVVESLDELLEGFLDRVTGYLRVEEVLELPEPLNEGAILAVVLRWGHPEAGPAPAAAAILPTGGGYGWPLDPLVDARGPLGSAEAMAMLFSFFTSGQKYMTPAFVKGRWAGFLSPDGHLPESSWDEAEAELFWRHWSRYRETLLRSVGRWVLPQELSAYREHLIRGYERALAAQEAWVEWGIGTLGQTTLLDPHRFLDLLAGRMELTAEEEASLRAILLAAGDDPERLEEAYDHFKRYLANEIVKGAWRSSLVEEARRLAGQPELRYGDD